MREEEAYVTTPPLLELSQAFEDLQLRFDASGIFGSPENLHITTVVCVRTRRLESCQTSLA